MRRRGQRRPAGLPRRLRKIVGRRERDQPRTQRDELGLRLESFLPEDAESLARETGFDVVDTYYDSERWFCDMLWRVRKSNDAEPKC